MNANETKAQHTPGPWRAHFALDINHDHYVTAGEQDQIIIARTGRHDIASAMDARLIAAAPELEAQRDELLAALKDICNGACWPLGGEKGHIAEISANKIEAARAAIERAEKNK